MKKYTSIHLLHYYMLLLTVIFSGYSMAQDETFDLKLKSGDYTVENNSEKFNSDPSYQTAELVDGNYYRIIHFETTPTIEGKAALEKSGIELLAYLPKRSFYAAIDKGTPLSVLSDYKATALVPVLPEYKLSRNLSNKSYPEWTLFANNIIGLNCIYFENLNFEQVQIELNKLGATVVGQFDGGVELRISISSLNRLYSSPFFYYFEELAAPETPEDYTDVANHRSNYINNTAVIGNAYDGTGVTIMMQDDGPIGPHIDYQGRTTSNTTFNGGDHGDHVAGIIMGAGNLDPDGVGNAPGAHLLVYPSGNTNFNLVPSLYDSQGLVITSKSYGDGNNDGYTTLCRTLDKQCRENEALVHVFSAGNSGTANYGYGAGSGWGNITGGHKQAKNVLAVGNLTATDVLNTSSSRGPAEDGRIKPDICAVGTDVYSTVDPYDYDFKTGTSMSCPGVAGSLALLYQAYREMNNGENPNAALINGAVLNTADDLGNPGPDFKHGWGRINVRRAYNLLENGLYQNGEVVQGGVNVHTIDVPANTKQLRVMVYWTDYEASPSASTALINDLNMVMSSPDATVYFPLVLNSTPNPGLLDQDAVPGVDDLNNVEQITVDNPMAGTYTVNIDGFDIPQGPQGYYIVYEFVEDEVVLTYPIGNESFVPSTQELIRWDDVDHAETYLIEYSIDNGLSWDIIANGAPSSWRSFPWTVPNEVSGACKVRITRGNSVSESAEGFSIIGQPNNLNVEWACENAFNFSWNPVAGATSYEVFLLGDKYMDSAGFSDTTNATVYANSLQTQWFSVRAIGPNGAIGKRAIAVEKSPAVFGCTLSPPAASFTAVCTETGPGSCIRFYDQSINAGQGAAWEWTFPGGTPSTSNLENPKICYDQEGNYDVQLVVKNGVGEDTVYFWQYVNIKKGAELPFSEDFESGQIPTNWILTTDGNGKNWEIENGKSAYGKGSSAIKFDNFTVDAASGISSFQTNQVDLSGETIYDLSFDVAYAQGVTFNDTLYVYASDDCGDSKTLIYKIGGAEMATTESDATYFVPLSTEWQKHAASLDAMANTASVSFIFENHSYDGNVLYVDNINVQVSEANFSEHELTVFPNPFGSEVNVAGLVAGEEIEMWIVDSNGKKVLDAKFIAWEGLITIPTDHLAAGVYVIRILSPSKTHKQKLVKIK